MRGAAKGIHRWRLGSALCMHGVFRASVHSLISLTVSISHPNLEEKKIHVVRTLKALFFII